VDVLSYRNDLAGTGVNASETELSPSNVKVGSFGKVFTTPLDAPAYAQPLIRSGVTIAPGVNTAAGASGVHVVVFSATEGDSVYAVDATTGAILWRRSFLDPGNPGGDVNNTMGATALGTSSGSDVNSRDLNQIGITGTPAIDPKAGILYVVAETKETIGGTSHDVQRVHALGLADGTDKATPFQVGDTVAKGVDGYSNNTPIYVYGTGEGSGPDTDNHTGRPVVAFNALRGLQRAGLDLVNGTLYVAWGSNGDNDPYHGWVAAWDVSQLASTGFRLSGVFNTAPNGGEGGVWQGGGKLAFVDDGSAMFFGVGNGPGGHGNPTLDAEGFPDDADYYDALLKVVADPASSPTHQNPNGWGLKVADYFIPKDQAALDDADRDFGSGAPVLLPDSAGIAGHPHLLAIAGKSGKAYLLDRDNLGKFDPAADHVVAAINLRDGILSTPTYADGKLIFVGGYGTDAEAFSIAPDGVPVPSSTTPPGIDFGFLPGGATVSSDGPTAGIVWLLDRMSNALRAFDASTLATELWDSNQRADGGDATGPPVKFASPTVANGMVYVRTATALLGYGLTPPPGAPPAAPTSLSAVPLSSTSIRLAWTDPSAAPAVANGFAVEVSTDGTHYRRATTVPGGATTIDLGGLAGGTAYRFRIHAYNGVGDSGPGNVASAATGSGSPQAPAAPSGLGASPASATSVALTWTNHAANQSGFALDRATDPAFTRGLTTRTFPGSTTSATDDSPGLVPGGTYYYRLRATNGSGASAFANTAAVNIPPAPATPIKATVTGVTTGSVNLRWTDRAGRTAEGYLVERRINRGVFTNDAFLPALNTATTGQAYTWTDTGVTPGTRYEYHILAYNSSGSNDFAGTNVTTVPLPPTGVSAVSGLGQATISWTAATGASYYNIYRGTSPGAETLLAGWVTRTSFTDTGVVPGTPYDYRVSAGNGNGSYVPPLQAEGPASAEVSVVAGTPVVLSAFTNRTGTVADGAAVPGGGLDGLGDAFSANLLGGTVAAGGVTYSLGQAGTNNAVAALGQTVALPPGRFDTLSFLGTSTAGARPGQLFVVHYADGSGGGYSQGMSDWRASSGYAGESTATATPHRARRNGTVDPRPANLYRYSFALDPTRTVVSVTLPRSPGVAILAADLLGMPTPGAIPARLARGPASNAPVLSRHAVPRGPKPKPLPASGPRAVPSRPPLVRPAPLPRPRMTAPVRVKAHR